MEYLNSLEAAAQCGMTLAYHAQQAPDRLAVASQFGDRSFSELNARANQVVRRLREAGLGTDDSVAMLLVNRPEFLEVLFACQRGGFRVTPINWHLTGDNASYIVGNCEAKAFIADVRCAEPAQLALQDHAGQLHIALAVGGAVEGFADYDDALAGVDAENLMDPEIGAQMLYTSGTTGRPKGVFRPRTPPAVVAAGDRANADTVTRASVAAAWNPETDRALCTGPAYHAAPLAFNIIAPINLGVGTVLMDKWDPEETLRLVQEYQITHTHMVATMFHRVLALPEAVRAQYDTSSLRYVLHGAAPCPVHVKQQMKPLSPMCVARNLRNWRFRIMLVSCISRWPWAGQLKALPITMMPWLGWMPRTLWIPKSARRCCTPRAPPAGPRACFDQERRRRLWRRAIAPTPTP